MLALKSSELVASEAMDGYFLASISDEASAEVVRTVARTLGWPDPVLRDGGAMAAIAFIRTADRPAALIVDLQESSDPVAEVRALRELCGLKTCLVAIGIANDVRLYRQLRDAGARDYLVKPLSADMMREAIDGALHAPIESTPAEVGARSIAMIGARGGVGVTTLAISVAWTIAQRQQKVVMLDLDLHFGSAALSLDLEPGRGLRELLGHPERIDRLLIDAAANNVGDRLRLLSAEEPLEDNLELGPEGLSVILHDLATTASFLVVDVPRTLNQLSRSMLMAADTVAVVTDLSLPAMRDTQRLISLVKLMRKDVPPLIIANRVGGVAGEVGRAEFERAIGLKLSHCIPHDRNAAVAAAETAKPFVDVARNPKTLSALHGLAQGFLGTGEVAAVARSSLLEKLLGK